MSKERLIAWRYGCNLCGETRQIVDEPGAEPRLPRGWVEIDGPRGIGGMVVAARHHACDGCVRVQLAAVIP